MIRPKNVIQYPNIDNLFIFSLKNIIDPQTLNIFTTKPDTDCVNGVLFFNDIFNKP